MHNFVVHLWIFVHHFVIHRRCVPSPWHVGYGQICRRFLP